MMVPQIGRSKTTPIKRRLGAIGENDVPVSRRQTFTSTQRRSLESRDDSLMSRAVAILATPVFREETRDPPPHDRFAAELSHLIYTDRDLLSITNEDEAFRTLKESLRQRGCVTNGYLRQNLHFFVKHVKDVRANRNKKAGSNAGRNQRTPRRQRMRRQVSAAKA